MSTVEARRRITSTSFRQLALYGSVATIFGGGGAWLYYDKVWLPEYRRKVRESKALAPVRRTQLYVAGTRDGDGLLAERRSMVAPLFYLYVTYRMVLLFMTSIPVIWFGFLTYGLHLCSQQIFYEKVVLFLTSMGPSYIKLGQWMATRPDFFPPDFCACLEKLYDRTAPHRWSHTEKVLRAKYTEGEGKDQNALRFISEIEKVPINSGSIAQVHRAKLRCSVDGVPAGTELALKVTHPYIREQVSADLAAMRLFLSVAQRLIPGLTLLNLESSLNEFSSLIRSQLNLIVECDNMRQFRYNFRDVKGVVFPTPLPSLSTEDVLFESFEDGEPLQNMVCSEENRDVAEIGCHMFLKMLFEDNFVHSDLHPGNVLLRTNHLGPTKEFYPDGKRKLAREIVVLDTGLVTTLSKEERNNFISLFAAVACGDGELGADLMLDRLPQSMKKKGKVDFNRDKFREEMKEVFDMVAPGTEGFKLSNIQIGVVLGKVLSTVRENQVPLDGNFSSLVLTVIVGEGLGRKLTPNFNIFAEASPYLVTFLEDKELFFLANKLRGTYGTTALLRNSVDLVRPEKAGTYVEVATRKSDSVVKKLIGVEE